MLRKYILGFLILVLILGASYLASYVGSPLSLDPLSILAIGLGVGFIVGTTAVGMSAKFSAWRTRIASAWQDKTSAKSENKTLYVGNLPFRTTRFELRELFQPYGTIHSARIMIDRATRKPKGYGFVEMDSKGAIKAINSLDGHTLAGRNLKVSEANQRDQA